MKDHLLAQGTRVTPQTEPLPMRPDQVENSAGGYVFAVDDWMRLNRFLILGSEGGSYYASERKLTTENVGSLQACIAADGPRTVQVIVDVSHSGRAPQNDAALYALAACISLGDRATKRAAAEALPRVARIGTHLYHFVAYAETMRGWGRTLRWAISNWYDRNPEQLALQAVKYRQRDGWTHRDLLRLAHPANASPLNAGVFDFMCGRDDVFGDAGDHGHPDADPVPAEVRIIEGYLRAQKADTPAMTAELVREYGLPREALKPEHLTDPLVWRALLDADMPLGAMTRNLANMTRYGILTGDYLVRVTRKLTDRGEVKAARLHPVSLLVALRTYASGRGMRGQNTWQPIPDVIDALDASFYLAFDNVEATGKRTLIGVDVSGSMTHGGVAGCESLTARDAAVAMALVTLHAEPSCHCVGFTSRLYSLPYSRRQRLDDALAATPRTGEGTDCALPIKAALDDLKSGAAGHHRFDAIVLYTDNETWAGTQHVTQAIEGYRQQSGLPTRLVACGMVANEFTVCDPNDSLSMNVIGFDTATPGLIAEFAAGRL